MENKELGRLVLKHVEAFPETFNMTNWVLDTPACGTVACLAGWTLLLHGGYTTEDIGSGLLAFFNSEGTRVHPGLEAMKILGVTPEEYFNDEGPLFYDSEENAVARLRRLVEGD